MSELSPEIKAFIEHEYGPVLARFTLNHIPQGGAPDYIKEQWIGTPLPVRESALAQLALGSVQYFDFLSFNARQNEDPVSIVGLEAVNALAEAGKDEAADFWTPYQAGLFTFRGYEGLLESLEQ